jgi:hypothetical protein
VTELLKVKAVTVLESGKELEPNMLTRLASFEFLIKKYG